MPSFPCILLFTSVSRRAMPLLFPYLQKASLFVNGTHKLKSRCRNRSFDQNYPTNGVGSSQKLLFDSNLSSVSQIVLPTMYRTAFRAGRQVYSSKLWRTIDLPMQSRSLAASITLARYSSNTAEKFSLEQIAPARDAFIRRHIGPNAVEEKEMLRTLNLQVNILHIASYCFALFCLYRCTR